MNLERPDRISVAESRVITLAFLSPALPAFLMGRQIARALASETDEPVALIQLARPSSGDTTTIRRSAIGLSGEFPLPAEIPNSEEGYYFLSLGENGELYQPEWIPSMVEQLRRRFRYVLI
ncbi:MAG: hypothetical protein ACREE6_17435, partial [Limisphaerales bacterium]